MTRDKQNQQNKLCGIEDENFKKFVLCSYRNIVNNPPDKKPRAVATVLLKTWVQCLTLIFGIRCGSTWCCVKFGTSRTPL